MIRIKIVDYWPLGTFPERLLSTLRSRLGDVEWSDTPDFLFYSVNGYEHLNYDCVRIFITEENIIPDFNICDYAIGFCRMTFGDRYLRYPLYFAYVEDYQRALRKHLLSETEIAQKSKFCNFVVSNNWWADAIRVNFFHLLSQYKQVDSGGKCLNNVGGPVPDKYEFQKQYKFSIAFENTSSPGYCTEKILQAFAAGTIPIYWGDPTVAQDFNEKAFVNCHAYKSFEEVIEKVKEIDADDTLFRQYLHEPVFTHPHTECPRETQEFWDYIVYICSQEPAKAKRRLDLMFGKWWQNDQRKFRRWERSYRRLKRICFPWKH